MSQEMLRCVSLRCEACLMQILSCRMAWHKLKQFLTVCVCMQELALHALQAWLCWQNVLTDFTQPALNLLMSYNHRNLAALPVHVVLSVQDSWLYMNLHHLLTT